LNSHESVTVREMSSRSDVFVYAACDSGPSAPISCIGVSEFRGVGIKALTPILQYTVTPLRSEGTKATLPRLSSTIC